MRSRTGHSCPSAIPHLSLPSSALASWTDVLQLGPNTGSGASLIKDTNFRTVLKRGASGVVVGQSRLEDRLVGGSCNLSASQRRLHIQKESPMDVLVNNRNNRGHRINTRTKRGNRTLTLRASLIRVTVHGSARRCSECAIGDPACPPWCWCRLQLQWSSWSSS